MVLFRPVNPQSNAIVERIHLTIGDSLRAMDLSNRTFDDTTVHGILQAIAWALRTTYHTSLRTSPGQLAFGQDMIVPATYLANWRHIHERRQKNICIIMPVKIAAALSMIIKLVIMFMFYLKTSSAS